MVGYLGLALLVAWGALTVAHSAESAQTDDDTAQSDTNLTTGDVQAQLEPIEFRCEPAEGADVLDVHVPSFRPDTTTETDVIEEVARHYGYGNIARTVPASFRIGRLTGRQTDRRALRQVLVGLGVDEAMPLPFLAPGDLEAVGARAAATRLS